VNWLQKATEAQQFNTSAHCCSGSLLTREPLAQSANIWYFLWCGEPRCYLLLEDEISRVNKVAVRFSCTSFQRKVPNFILKRELASFFSIGLIALAFAGCVFFNHPQKSIALLGRHMPYYFLL